MRLSQAKGRPCATQAERGPSPLYQVSNSGCGETSSLCLCPTGCLGNFVALYDPPKIHFPISTWRGYHLAGALACRQSLGCFLGLNPLLPHLCTPRNRAPEPPRAPRLPASAARAGRPSSTSPRLQRCALGLPPGKTPPRAEVQQE